MCGRYYIDDDTFEEIEKFLLQIEKNADKTHTGHCFQIPSGDIHPTDLAPVLTSDGGHIRCVLKRWGFPGYSGNSGNSKPSGRQVLFNARSESALEKPTFRESVLHRRIVIPASLFYEWNQKKEKYFFSCKNQPVLYMAGCFCKYQEEDRFVILTTAANASMLPVHDRMPLILNPDEVEDWILNDKKTEAFLQKTPCILERETDYEQISLF